MSDCKAFRREIVEDPDGGSLSRAARAHAESCRVCGAELRERLSLSALMSGLGKVEAPADFDYRLRARMAAGGAGGRRAPLRGLRFIYAFAPVAAAACFLVVATALYLRQAATNSPAEATTAGVAEQARNPEPSLVGATPAVGPVEASKLVKVRPSEVASKPNVFTPRPPAVDRPRAASRASGKALESSVDPAGQRSATLSLTSARVMFPERPSTGGGLTIALKTPSEPMRMVLRDERGAGRVVPMRPVSFGSQELIAREGLSRQAASAEENEGVW